MFIVLENCKTAGGFIVVSVLGVREKSGMHSANNQLLTCCASHCRAISWPISLCTVGQAHMVSSARFSLIVSFFFFSPQRYYSLLPNTFVLLCACAFLYLELFFMHYLLCCMLSSCLRVVVVSIKVAFRIYEIKYVKETI